MVPYTTLRYPTLAPLRRIALLLHYQENLLNLVNKLQWRPKTKTKKKSAATSVASSWEVGAPTPSESRALGGLGPAQVPSGGWATRPAQSARVGSSAPLY